MQVKSMKVARLFALALAFAATACASGGTAGGGSSRSSSGRLTEADLAQFASQDIVTVIQRLRPQWLQVRGGGGTTGRSGIQVIVDGQKQQGGLDSLRGMSANTVQEASFMNARDATTRYGTDMGDGAIIITTKR